MHRVKIEGTTIELTTGQFLDLVGRTVTSIYHSAEGIYASHQFGSPGKLQPRFAVNMLKDLDLLGDLGSQVDDEETGLGLKELQDSLFFMIKTGEDMIEWINESGESHGSGIDEQMLAHSGLGMGDRSWPANFSLPVLLQNPRYKKYLNESSKHMENAINAIVRSINGLERLRQAEGIEGESETERLLASKIERLRPVLREGLQKMIDNSAGKPPDDAG